jgi:hypothetical protein
MCSFGTVRGHTTHMTQNVSARSRLRTSEPTHLFMNVVVLSRANEGYQE